MANKTKRLHGYEHRITPPSTLWMGKKPPSKEGSEARGRGQVDVKTLRDRDAPVSRNPQDGRD